MLRNILFCIGMLVLCGCASTAHREPAPATPVAPATSATTDTAPVEYEPVYYIYIHGEDVPVAETIHQKAYCPDAEYEIAYERRGDYQQHSVTTRIRHIKRNGRALHSHHIGDINRYIKRLDAYTLKIGSVECSRNKGGISFDISWYSNRERRIRERIAEIAGKQQPTQSLSIESVNYPSPVEFSNEISIYFVGRHIYRDPEKGDLVVIGKESSASADFNGDGYTDEVYLQYSYKTTGLTIEISEYTTVDGEVDFIEYPIYANDDGIPGEVDIFRIPPGRYPVFCLAPASDKREESVDDEDDGFIECSDRESLQLENDGLYVIMPNHGDFIAYKKEGRYELFYTYEEAYAK